MAIKASTSINSSVKAADSSSPPPRETCPQLLQRAVVGRREAAGLSPKEVRYPRGTSRSTGSSLPGLALGSANPEERGFRKVINTGEWR